MTKWRRPTFRAVALVMLAVAGAPSSALGATATEDLKIALDLAAMLRAARSVIAEEQKLINDASLADKGLTGDVVLAKALEKFKRDKRASRDPIDPATRRGRLLKAQMEAIRTVMAENQSTINEAGLGFKGFVPAVFARLVNEEFRRTSGREAEVKVTAPPVLVRNRKASPDPWETANILGKLAAPGWEKGKILTATAPNRDRDAFRVLVPEYYGKGCLVCHGTPKGELDVTGYPKEGGKVGDLGGVMSITLYRQ